MARRPALRPRSHKRCGIEWRKISRKFFSFSGVSLPFTGVLLPCNTFHKCCYSNILRLPIRFESVGFVSVRNERDPMTTKQSDRPADAKWGYEFGIDGTWTTEQACERMHVTDETLRAWAESGKIRRSKPGLRCFFCIRSINEFLRDSEV